MGETASVLARPPIPRRRAHPLFVLLSRWCRSGYRTVLVADALAAALVIDKERPVLKSMFSLEVSLSFLIQLLFYNCSQ